MGALPKERISRGRQGKRRQAISLKVASSERCPQCGGLKRPHVVCSSCGSYKGKTVVFKKEKKSKKKGA